MKRFLEVIISLSILFSIPLGVVRAEGSGGLETEQFYMDGQVNYNNEAVQKQTQAFTGDKGADLGRVKDPRIVIASVIQSFLVILGTLFLVYMIYAGYLILTSAGNEDRVDKGKSILRNAIIGLAIILLSYSATWVVRWLFVASGDKTYEDCVPIISPSQTGDPLSGAGGAGAQTTVGCE
ncbi:MAG: hypothetical protein UV82_C0012G0022 [Candidatus Magasanikbacteria bacterium GW2011_GWD2_43_18]|uniref:Uncharacterized protein n=1 Tax=Candidatus Magasanikbacteria bacterium GW2011_GWE2_42_7 TaxID=1619052 RepID=A0A0G1BHA9_9BACT|nr:MAG: hypothetical protein UV18_C0005G0109 [Candidatus Magasanikbacteria bacterium GW2011_GWC2_42_27]KKS72795.1 MAG: hypothetical protein UV42_C0004G0007 [Candidatus Magasanikbacteria bacterium GW2011_GWE2_42_7]KKT04037.1 MAG: hypothetical protein UV82_C0012G0022 [Candidatus Magasanikbacteria bacterium GW2011_GWD2_43_18]KKT25955.1 MAG: hypothetical protein UW10_C0003G0116 [Candidatus Magasanikbacteria bacterium GW2011_GWA2_43_9]HBB37930.1 hypothetical protein [Candidatus Magasanikbacteria bac